MNDFNVNEKFLSQKAMWLLVSLWMLQTVMPHVNGDIDPELIALLKKAKADISKFDPKKVTPSCRKGMYIMIIIIMVLR